MKTYYLDHILSSKRDLVSQVKVLYGETFEDHISIYCELVFPNSAFTKGVDEATEVKFNIVLEDVSDDQLETYDNILDNFSNKWWTDFLSCNTISYDNALHHQQLDQFYSALVEIVSLTSGILLKTFQHREKYTSGWNHFRKSLHVDAR